MTPAEQVLQLFGTAALYGGGSVALALAVFRFLGKSWIENKFAKSLEEFRHEQAIEIQRLRVEVESMLSGALRLQELEFNVLPTAWKKLDDAYGYTSTVAVSMQRYISVDRMTPQELEELLSASALLESQRAKIRDANGKDRSDIYQTLVTWQRLRKAQVAVNDLDTYIAGNGLFLPAPLKKQFLEIIPIIRGAIIAVEVSIEVEDYKFRTRAADELQTAAPLLRNIETAIEDRLHSHARP